mmetsp:Transcript_104768/g.303219  ORF Transcript_104768/g.303219 Transcript_104768/m.303219 type:complete len:84 (-) Transcript_104768:581-832(-)
MRDTVLIGQAGDANGRRASTAEQGYEQGPVAATGRPIATWPSTGCPMTMPPPAGACGFDGDCALQQQDTQHKTHEMMKRTTAE